jgi:putative ABC transport system permease protein
MAARCAAARFGKHRSKPVLGSTVAATSGLGVGTTFTGSHGLAEGGGEHAAAPYRVTGVLAPTGTVLDRLVLTSIASVWAVHEEHHAGADHGAHEKEAKGQESAEEHAELESGREVTLALVRYRSPLAAASLPRAINKETELVAASPAYETARLLTVFGVGIDLIRAFALVLMAAPDSCCSWRSPRRWRIAATTWRSCVPWVRRGSKLRWCCLSRA